MSLAKDVAKELAKQQRRRRLLVLGGLAALIAIAFLYLHCGAGWGFGGSGDGSGSGTATGTGTAVAARCAVRIDAAGTTIDGAAATPAQVVARCKNRGVEVVITGDARQGDWDALRTALDAASVATFVKH